MKIVDGCVGSPLAVAYLIYKSFPEISSLNDDGKSMLLGAILRFLRLRLGLIIWAESSIASCFATVMETERDMEARDFCEKILNKYCREYPEESKIITRALQKFREKFLLGKENPGDSIQEQLIKQAIDKAMEHNGDLVC